MLNRRFIISVEIMILAVLIPGSAQVLARMKMPEASRVPVHASAAGDPAYCLTAHRVGNMVLAVTNNGTFGINYIGAAGNADCFTGESIGQSVQFPKRNRNSYLYSGSFWIGAVVGRDTLVSLGHTGWSGSSGELNPDVEPIGNMIRRSIIDPSSPQFEGAISEEDLIAVYTDTIMESVGYGTDLVRGGSHIPLNIKVVERSFAWSYPYAEDFVLFDYAISNIGQKNLVDVYMGLYVDSDIHNSELSNGYTDDISGFLKSFPSPLRRFKGCGFIDTVNIAWTADNDGDLNLPEAGKRVPSVTATRIVRTPNPDSLEVSFNWWVSGENDFGPRHRTDRFGNPPRNLGHGGLGTPDGDANKYAFLSNGEFDYDQPLIGTIGDADPLWLPVPNQLVDIWVKGMDTRYLLSFGPFDISPGQTLPLSFAYLGGENFHTVEGNVDNLPNDPGTYYDNLGWDDLALNSVWAEWLFDNPGVDTDSNGYAGEQRVCIREAAYDSIWDTSWVDPDSTIIDKIILVRVDTIPTRSDTSWYKGDGVPDFKGAQPPPAPSFTIEPMVGALKVRFNGTRSETTRDNFSTEFDFEGYRIYVARDPRASSYAMFTSYDLEDYNRYVLKDGYFQLLETPFTMAELRCLYGDPATPGGPCNDDSFDPLSYSITNTLSRGDDEMYFLSQGENMSYLGVNTDIKKVYPDQPYPSSFDPKQAHPDEVTSAGDLKYFEYEALIPDLLEGVEYWVGITAFDFGSPASGLPSLETAVPSNAKAAYPVNTWEEVELQNLEVYVYPNPYRIDADYRGRGFEGRVDIDRPADRTRALNFGNLPPNCTIRIFTIDGDLIQQIDHNRSSGAGDATNDSWDLITRNFQLVVSGLYFWTVEDKRGNTQMGKFSIVM